MTSSRVIPCFHQGHQGFHHAHQGGFFPPLLWMALSEEGAYRGIVGHTHLVAAKALGPIHGMIGGGDESFSLLGMRGTARHAHRTRQMEASADTEGMGCHRSSHF